MAAAAIQSPLAGPQVGSTLPTAHSTQRHVQTTLNYYKPNADGSPPHATYYDRPETYYREAEPHTVTVHDVSGDEAKYTLDGNGFQFVARPATETEFRDDDQIRASYYPETEQLLKDVTGASRVFIFDHTIRRDPPEDDGQRNFDRSRRGPVQRVHIDQSYRAALSRVPHHLPAEDAEKLLRGRVQIINVWRPIENPVLRDPLAVAEAASVGEEALVPTGLVLKDREGETYQVRYESGHRWFFKSGLAPDEALLIKCFDSKTDGRARRVPHTAFDDPAFGRGSDAPPRQSIEVRALVFHPEDTE
ncbi:uncharacterized protein SPSK_10897 [Sporothrix schenckii 1099-18]|uniref:Methyltransferase n=2 Tax=Sporothrix schenckii TaxID=29908 RepID=U7Q0I3_SPOS1|nr:uncharacterized protein SPSK_10897 [Sporothrix schenckii 1099-18]ERT00241.1 hypothetical protein HMPREF1624_03612 [Sporothrix schenckii ATCC 58251]KJR85299.1 hypothetical protein SPSK_10897 [Sporothrix schenckii 1099-18]